MLDLLPNYQLQSLLQTHFCSTSILQSYIRGSEICFCCGITVVYNINYYLDSLFIYCVQCCTVTCFWMSCIHKVDWMSDWYCWSIVLLAVRQLIIGHGCGDKSRSIGCSSSSAHPDSVGILKEEGSPVTWQQGEHTHTELSSQSFQTVVIKSEGWEDPGEHFLFSCHICQS